LGFSSGLINSGYGVSFDFVDHDSLLTFSLGDHNRSILLSLDLFGLFLSVSMELILLLINSRSFDLHPELVHLSLIRSLKISELLLLLILKGQFPVLLLFLVVLKFKLESGFFLEGSNELWIHMYVCDVTLFECDTVLGELEVELLHHRLGHVGLEIEDLTKPDRVDEGPHVLFNLGCKKLVKSCSTEFIDKVHNLSLNYWHSKGKMDIHVNIGIILGRTSLDWGIVVND